MFAGCAKAGCTCKQDFQNCYCACLAHNDHIPTVHCVTWLKGIFFDSQEMTIHFLFKCKKLALGKRDFKLYSNSQASTIMVANLLIATRIQGLAITHKMHYTFWPVAHSRCL